jgi:hypothetical protein
VRSLIIDWRTFTPQLKTLYGVYGDDFIAFGEYAKTAGNPLENDELLLKIVDENDKTTVFDRTVFRFENSKLVYKREVNGEILDTEIEHQVTDGELEPMIEQSWSEVFFYGIGNKNIAAPKMKEGE